MPLKDSPIRSVILSAAKVATSAFFVGYERIITQPIPYEKLLLKSFIKMCYKNSFNNAPTVF